jgi:hypothetical protein
VVALARAESRNARSFWKFRCDCGVEKEIDAAHVRYGRIRSCGCLLDDVLHSQAHAARCALAAKFPRSHGMSKTPVHAVWKAMIQRCTNARSRDYRWYGALGVKVCERWRSFENFYADMGEPRGMTIDRIDPRGDYEPLNCRWADWATQRSNKRNSNAKHHASA